MAQEAFWAFRKRPADAHPGAFVAQLHEAFQPRETPATVEEAHQLAEERAPQLWARLGALFPHQ